MDAEAEAEAEAEADAEAEVDGLVDAEVEALGDPVGEASVGPVCDGCDTSTSSAAEAAGLSCPPQADVTDRAPRTAVVVRT
ncbi:hypothetical protein ACIQFZ_28905 [Streptomyces sp. NPDC093064]|uniref:hypothetical protein n=1 Tax=Streptomyces sp. NPDC093064 TaxID=3366020 RepID=UPI00381E3F89